MKTNKSETNLNADIVELMVIMESEEYGKKCAEQRAVQAKALNKEVEKIMKIGK